MKQLSNNLNMKDSLKLTTQAIKRYVDNQIAENGFSGDYNDLNNRPCYDNSESIECTYDGNATGRVVATDPFEAMVKVSDEVIDYETYLKSVVGIHYPDGIQYHKISDKIEGEDYFLTKSKKMIWGGNVTVVYEDNVELWGAVFPERGIYFHDASLLIGYNDPSYVCSFSAVIKEGEIKQLDEKFIPDTIATKKYVDDTTPQLDTRAYTGKTVTISYSGDQNDYDTKITINENGWGYPFVFVRMKDSISYDEFYSGVSYDMKWSDGFIETFECNGCDKINDDCEFINSFIYNIRKAINSTELSNFVGYDFESVNIPEGLWFADYSASQGGDILEVPLSFTYEEIEGELRPVNKDDRLATKDYVDDNKGLNHITGTEENPIILTDLDIGTYEIDGKLKTYPDSTSLKTVFNGLIVVERKDASISKGIYSYNGLIYSFAYTASANLFIENKFVKDEEVLTRTNTSDFTPTADYNPATKKYVDDAIANASLGNGSDVSDSGVIEDSEFDNLISGTFGPEYVNRDE